VKTSPKPAQRGDSGKTLQGVYPVSFVILACIKITVNYKFVNDLFLMIID
jgi:hypothetical protein